MDGQPSVQQAHDQLLSAALALGEQGHGAVRTAARHLQALLFGLHTGTRTEDVASAIRDLRAALDARAPSPRPVATTTPPKAEAHAYVNDPVLGARLQECVQAMLAHPGKSAREILGGDIDAEKFHASMTLFAHVAPQEPCFQQALNTFFQGQPHPATLHLLGGQTRG